MDLKAQLKSARFLAAGWKRKAKLALQKHNTDPAPPPEPEERSERSTDPAPPMFGG